MGKGKYLLGIVLVIGAAVLLYMCNRKEVPVIEDILPVDKEKEHQEKTETVSDIDFPEVVKETEPIEKVVQYAPPQKKKIIPAPVTEPEEIAPMEQPIKKPEEKEEEKNVPVQVEEVAPVQLQEEFIPVVSEVPLTRKTFDRGIKKSVFTPKGLWMVGGTFSYTEANGSDFNFLVLKNMQGKGYSFSVSPAFCYFFRDNMGAGGRFTYSREFVDLGNIDIELNEDLTFKIDNASMIEHMFYGTGFIRMYTNLGNSLRIALFNEARFTFGAGQAKTFSGTGQTLDGVYQNIKRLQIGMSPGVAAFITNDLAIDVSIGVLGFDTKWIKQDHNKVVQGSYHNTSGKFKIDLFRLIWAWPIIFEM